MDGYEVKVYFSADDDCYVAEIIEFVGCAADGPTPEAALANLRELKPVWMQAVIANGYAVPPPRRMPSSARRTLVTA